jgi:hypothetical protein
MRFGCCYNACRESGRVVRMSSVARHPRRRNCGEETRSAMPTGIILRLLVYCPLFPRRWVPTHIASSWHSHDPYINVNTSDESIPFGYKHVCNLFRHLQAVTGVLWPHLKVSVIVKNTANNFHSCLIITMHWNYDELMLFDRNNHVLDFLVVDMFYCEQSIFNKQPMVNRPLSISPAIYLRCWWFKKNNINPIWSTKVSKFAFCNNLPLNVTALCC